MQVTVIGCGYVGLCAGVCLASAGHTVVGVEKIPEKLQSLKDGVCPIFEPGLAELMTENMREGRLRFTEDVEDAIREADVVYLAVGTPPLPDGTADTQYLEAAGREVCDALQSVGDSDREEPLVIIVKSTVPAGTNRKLSEFLHGSDDSLNVAV
ncbi:MAG: 3-hydroxyacyl-CoA dehydrogenase NAD-binding domain-containing protein, partial [Planctomycetota bacterium]